MKKKIIILMTAITLFATPITIGKQINGINTVKKPPIVKCDPISPPIIPY